MRDLLENRAPERHGEPLRSPDEAVRAGLRSASRWTKLLSEATEKQSEVLVAELVSGGRRFAELEHPVERRAVSDGRTILGEGGPAGPISAMPLIFQGSCVGLLAIHSLLSHKKSLSGLDRELFDLLGEQAASAIVSARTFSAVDRKLRTAKGFLSLLG